MSNVDLEMLDLAVIEICKIQNEIGTTWKVKRALLRTQFPALTETQIAQLVPADDSADY